MNRMKKILSGVVALGLVFLMGSSQVRVSAAEYILDPAQAKGSDYTQSDKLAKALEQVFSGDVDIFSDAGCTQEVAMPLGISMSTSTQYYVKSKVTGNKVSGWQCYIYANGVYNQLFQEWVGHAAGFAHSHTVIPGGGNKLTYEMLVEAGVRCGAYLRTTGNQDGSYNGNVGHSMLLLSYDEESITYLEGNADGNGLVRITTRSWSDFNQRQLSGKSRYIAHIAQPKDEVYEQMYPVCSHEFGSMGSCALCGWAFSWETTRTLDGAGYYQVLQELSPSENAPYREAASQEKRLTPGQQVKAVGACQNALGEQWYICTDETGAEYFLPADSLEFVEMLPFEVICRDFSPADQALLERKSQPVKGTVISTYPIREITAYLDGVQYASWTAPDERTLEVELRGTDVNRLLSFSTLEKGRHTITLKLRSFLFDEPMTIHESVFYMEEYASCQHSYQSQITQPPTCTQEGLQTDQCSLCGDRQTQVIPALGHVYTEGSCMACGQKQDAGILVSVESFFDAQAPTIVTLWKAGETVGQSRFTGLTGSCTFETLQPGEYTLEVRKPGCVTRETVVKLAGEATQVSIRLCQLGDLSGDGRVNVGDTARLYAHVRNTDPIKVIYTLQCGDLSQDGSVNIGDVGKLYALVKQG